MPAPAAAAADGSKDDENIGIFRDRTAAPRNPPPARPTAAAMAAATDMPILSERKRRLREKINELVNKLAHHSGTRHEDIHSEWKRRTNGKGNGAATAGELERKLEWIKNKIIAFNRDAGRPHGGR